MKFSRQKSLRVGMLQKAKWRRESSPRMVSRLLVIGVFLAILAGIVLVSMRQSLAFLTDNPLYAIVKLDIATPMYLTPEDVTALSGVSKGDNLLKLPIKEVRKRLMEHPNIKEAVVQRVLPNVLRIGVTEREPLAQINVGKSYLVDAEGSVDLASQTITLNGKPYTPVTPVTVDGNYILTVEATDTAGNTSVATVRFTIKRPPLP